MRRTMQLSFTLVRYEWQSLIISLRWRGVNGRLLIIPRDNQTSVVFAGFIFDRGTILSPGGVCTCVLVNGDGGTIHMDDHQ